MKKKKNKNKFKLLINNSAPDNNIDSIFSLTDKKSLSIYSEKKKPRKSTNIYQFLSQKINRNSILSEMSDRKSISSRD